MNYILAEKNGDRFHPQTVADSVDVLTEQLEYGDVKEGLFQIWEHPSGTIYDLSVDNELEPKQYYSVQYGKQGRLWTPVLRQVSLDVELVETAFKRLTER